MTEDRRYGLSIGKARYALAEAMMLTSSLYSVIAFNFIPGVSLVHETTVLSLIC